jgi:hypothetical protein
MIVPNNLPDRASVCRVMTYATQGTSSRLSNPGQIRHKETIDVLAWVLGES